MRVCEQLLESGLFVQGIRPPTVPDGSSRLRISLSALHTPDQINRLAEALAVCIQPVTP
jgi:7-keto-8-aminopelargonate synthetase-like enzyme